MSTETFKIFDLNTNYSISSHWRVLNVKKNKFLKLSVSWWLYYLVNLRIAWIKRSMSVHRLVAYCFLWLDIFDTKSVVRHWDDNWFNNNVSNLSLWTAKDNVWDCIKRWRYRCSKGESHYLCKLTNKDIEEIKLLYSKWGIAQWRIWEIYWVGQDVISRIINDKTKKKSQRKNFIS